MDLFDVGPSRDGDQFHYSRASRLCLELLEAGSDLMVVSVEGISKKDSVSAGIESIDLALYYGSTSLPTARLVRYRQLKHSTLHASREWTASGLRKTLKDFALRFTALVGQFGVEDVCARFAFEFETNRPLSPRVEQALSDLKQCKQGREARYISRVTGLAAADLQAFASLFRPFTRVEGFLKQRALLNRDLRAYLPDNDKDAALALRELVARKATSEFKTNREIRREDVLDTIGVRLDDLFPAANVLESPSVVVPRSQLPNLLKVITESSTAVIVSADGGYGKSIVATQIGPALPGSATFVYDCFGNGGYRSITGLRHRAKDGLVQLANEMAAQGLCHPLIPTPKADDAAYVHAFLARVEQASAAIRGRDANAYLVLVVDAADNAEMAAKEFHDPPSFPRLLLAESFPDNVRLVLTARPHRVDMLQPSPEVVRFDLDGFTETETGDLLKSRFPRAGYVDILEFQRLTSRNPRVQRAALDLDPSATLATVLRSLGPSPRTVDDTIGDLLEQAVRQVRHVAATVEQPQIDRICAALATLRPFVPIRIIALTAGVDDGLVRSFIHDLGRPLLLRDDSVQFRDEPTETWFQKHFRPEQEELEVFVRRLKPLARSSPYAAAALPALMLSTDRLDELVRLALDDEALPENDEIARRDVELQRLEFATRAALRARRYVDGAKLALKAGGRVAADDRQQTLLSSNVDLASRFLSADQLLEQVSRRQVVGGNWTGSEHAYEAALLSGREGLEGEARSRLRIAYDWVNHWVRNRQEGDLRTSVQDKDIVELQWAELNVHGPTSCAAQLRRWSPRELSYRVGRTLAKRLVDAARWADAAALAMAAGNDIGLVLAVADELRSVERHVPKAAAIRTMRLLLHSRVKLKAPSDWRGEGTRIGVVVSMIDTARHYRLASKRALAGLLRRYLPKAAPPTLDSEHLSEDRFAYLRAYALLAALLGKPLTLEFIYGAKRSSRRRLTDENRFSGRGFANLKALLPWHELSVNVRSGSMSRTDFEAALTAALEYWTQNRRDVSQDWSATADGVARLWSECIVLRGGDEACWARLTQWQDDLRIPLFIPSIADIARRAALTDAPPHIVLFFAHKARTRIGEEAELAESMADSFILLARSVLGASEDEALQYFNEGVRVASKIGQENLERWHALLHLSDVCGVDRTDSPHLAYRFARAAELTRSYVDRDKHFDWEHTVEAIATLSASTSPAIMSRWRDRRFGEPERLFPKLVDFLCKRGDLDARDAAALVCFNGYWEWPGLIAAALDAADSSAEKDKVLLHTYRYLRLSGMSRRSLKEAADAVQVRGLNAQSFRELEEQASRPDSEVASRKVSLTSGHDSGPDWAAVFAGIDICSASGLLECRERMPDGRFGRWREEWIGEAVVRVTAGKERAFVESLHAVDDWSPYAVRGLLEQIPPSWADRLAARQALAWFVRRMARDHATSLSINRHYQHLSYDLVFEKSGVTRQELLRCALEAIAETSLPSSSHDLFQLVAVLAQFLGPEEARSVLDYGLEQLEETLGGEQGQEPRSLLLAPANGCRESIAGYIWAALGAVDSRCRWQAAHAVRALCHLGRDAMLSDILAFARGGDSSAFTDASFHFYRMHAIQWLLIALDRASRESADAVSSHVSWLESLASRQNRHVIFRALAARALLALADRGRVEIDPAARGVLIQINASRLPTQLSAYHARPHRDLLGSGDSSDFAFDYDFSSTWIKSLARCFGISPEEIEALACRVIREDWGLQENGHYVRDARAQRGQFKEYVGRRGSKLGGQDTLSIYLSYHAVMEAAGHLLETHPLYEDPDSSWGTFSHWLERNVVLDAKGDWIADHRQMPPLDAVAFPKIRKKDSWPVPITAKYALSRLGVRLGAVVVAGRWTQFKGRNSETFRVTSALVSQARASALSRALATTRNPYDYALPEFQDSHEIHHGDFLLEGWVEERGSESSAYSDDPWAGGLAECFPDLAEPLAADFGVARDEACDKWYQDDGACVAWVERWSEGVDDERERVPSGERLVVDKKFLQRVLGRLERTLILEVTCRRDVVLSNYESRNKNAKEERSTHIITIEKAGSPRLVSRNLSSRRKARRRT
ncbi:AVAST type 3 anti-phage nuclease/ATPase Avs3a [Pseudomonas aeruginosa]|uniref:AVAST type 3 anti-phage nuclease/ATPase Avs3a n=1 Tax=Pseudomonas aeruginosa TaxID=287 RepID=UPI003D9C0FE4